MEHRSPCIDELVQTVARMEARFGAAENPRVRELFSAYLALKPRFAADLPDKHDHALACSAALMLIQQVAACDTAPVDRAK